MKTVVKSIKTAAVTALFASTAMLSTNASAILIGEGGTIISYMSSYQNTQNFCSNTEVTCLSVTQEGSVWKVIWY